MTITAREQLEEIRRYAGVNLGEPCLVDGIMIQLSAHTGTWRLATPALREALATQQANLSLPGIEALLQEPIF